jgi:hypothetical protein
MLPVWTPLPSCVSFPAKPSGEQYPAFLFLVAQLGVFSVRIKDASPQLRLTLFLLLEPGVES